MNNLQNCAHNPDGWCLDCVRAERLLHIMEAQEIEQILGKALGYPWIKDDQKNFPGATEADGVCVGEHVPATLAMEVAAKLNEFQILGEQFMKHLERARDRKTLHDIKSEPDLCSASDPSQPWYSCKLRKGHDGPHIVSWINPE